MTEPAENIPGRPGEGSRKLEAVTDAAERLGAMGQTIDVQRRDVEIGAVVEQSSVSGAEEHMIGDVEVGAAAVQERSAGLRVGGGHVVGIKHQRAGSRQNEGREAPRGEAEHVGRGGFMRIRVQAGSPGGQRVVLRVEGIAVVQLDATMVVEEKTIAAQNASAVGGALLDAVVGGALHKTAESLDGSLLTADRLLGKSGKCEQPSGRQKRGEALGS